MEVDYVAPLGILLYVADMFYLHLKQQMRLEHSSK
jgi:hypothetical protein